jgi:hypothetical protein
MARTGPKVIRRFNSKAAVHGRPDPPVSVSGTEDVNGPAIIRLCQAVAVYLQRSDLTGAGRILRISSPLPLFIAGPGQLFSLAQLHTFTPAGHRVLVELDKQVIGYADFGPPRRELKDTFRQFAAGELATHLVLALRRGLRVAGSAAASVAVLDIPSQASSAVWVRGTSDRFIPYAPFRRERIPAVVRGEDYVIAIGDGYAYRAGTLQIAIPHGDRGSRPPAAPGTPVASPTVATGRQK